MCKVASLINDNNIEFIEKMTISSEIDVVNLISLLNQLKANPINITKFINMITKNLQNKIEVIIEKGDNGIYITTNIKPTKNLIVKSKDDVYTYKIDIVSENATLFESNEDEFLDFDGEDEFFEFDSEEVDENINDMHFVEHQKISASNFMQEEFIDEELVDDIKEIIEEIYNLNEDDDYLTQYMDVILLFIRFFNSSVEFKDLSYGLEKLINLLKHNYDFIKKNEVMIGICKSILEDLVKFTETVIIEQNAIDIHYLDASLLANVTQLELILNKLKEK